MKSKGRTSEDKFNSKWGFIISCIGSSVGMANIWLFPYRAGEFGGAAFLIPYVIFVILISAIVSHKMAGPVYRFEQTCKAIAKGDFSQRVHLRKGDQLTDLQDEFNNMMDRVEEEIKKSKNGGV